MNLLKKGEYVKTKNEKELDAVLKLHYDAGVEFVSGLVKSSKELNREGLIDSYPISVYRGYNLFYKSYEEEVFGYGPRQISDFIKPKKMLFWDDSEYNKEAFYPCGVVEGAKSPFLAVHYEDEEEYLKGDEFDFDRWKNCEPITEANTIEEITAIAEKMPPFTIDYTDGILTVKPL